ncbi:MAG: GNAT family N-acetyltransferase [Peptococcaceae bacterium]|nr:GNAT family N-acetyltransferase [Peptococcaceae bacterium]
MDRFDLETPKGLVHIEGPVDGEYLQSLEINEKLTNFRPAKRQKAALIEIAGLPDGIIYIARHGNEIIGYVTFHPTDEFIRWHKHPRVLEMGGIEISPDWRQCRIAENLMRVAFSNKTLDDFIVITMEYCWHWDLANTRMDVWAYQKMLTGLFAKVGLKKITTDDPDIIDHPANVLMAKFGKNVSEQDIMLFETLRFLGRQGSSTELT